MVFCGTASALAMSPAASPSGSCFTSRRNTSSRVGWARAVSARMACSDSIYPDIWIYRPLSSLSLPSQPAYYFYNSRNTVDGHQFECHVAVMKLDDAAAHLEALGNPTRLKIYRALVRAGDAGMPVGR